MSLINIKLWTGGIKWIGLYSSRQINPFYCDIKPVLNFLGRLFQAEYDCKTISCQKLVLFDYDNAFKVGGQEYLN